MAAVIFENGPTIVSVKGPSGSSISSLSTLGVADSPITVSQKNSFDNVIVDPFGPSVPVDLQYNLTEMMVSMNLIYFDETVLRECMRLSNAGGSAAGTMPRAGTLMGGGNARFAAGNNFIGLNLSSAVESVPWRFYSAFIADSFNWPLGTQRSSLNIVWRCIPYSVNILSGSAGALLYDHTADT